MSHIGKSAHFKYVSAHSFIIIIIIIIHLIYSASLKRIHLIKQVDDLKEERYQCCALQKQITDIIII